MENHNNSEKDVALTGLHLEPLSPVAFREALNAELRHNLPQMALAFGILFVLLAVGHLTALQGALRVTMLTVALTTALTSFVIRWQLRQRTLPLKWAHPLAALLSLTILLNTLLHLFITQDMLQTTNVLLFIIAVGFLLFFTFWWVLLVGLAVGSWVVYVLLTPWHPDWFHFAFAMLSTVTVSWVVHSVRLRTSRRLETFRYQETQQRLRLQATVESRERVQHALQTTVEVMQHITSILDVKQLLNQVVALIQERYGYYYVGIMLLDKSGEYIKMGAGTGEVGRRLREQAFRLRVGAEGLIGWVAQHRQPLNVSDVTQEARYFAIAEMPDTRAELVLPLEVGDVILGALDIQSVRLAAFAEADVAVLQSLAGQVAVALQNATSYEAEYQRRLFSDKLQDVGRALSQTVILSEVLPLILEKLADIVPYDRGAVMLEAGDEMIFSAVRGFPAASNRQNLHVKIKPGDIYLDIQETQRPVLIPDIQQRPDWQHVADLPPACSWLGVPLVLNNIIIGMLSLARERPNPYTEAEVTLASAFANQAAVALGNAELYANLDAVNAQLETTVQQLRLTYAQLERLDRTKSDFITVVSHELRTPLTVLQGYSQILLGDPQIAANEYHHQLVEGIHAGTERLHTIVNSMLDMVKIDNRVLQLHPEPLTIALLVASICQRLSNDVDKRQLTLHIAGLEGLPTIQADIEAIRKVFYHLIVNAIKYTPDGGTLTVSGRTMSAEDVAVPSGGGIEITVKDTGIGIAPDVQKLIFAKFYQTGEVAVHSSGATKFKGGGPGLGLAIARGIVEAHGGDIWVESPGYDEAICPGSTFFVVLPLHPEQALDVVREEGEIE